MHELHEVDEHSVEGAHAAAEQDRLGDWVASFLASPGSDNAELAEQLSDPPRAWLGPVEVPIDQLHRLAGPPGEPVLVTTDEDDWRDDVDDLAGHVRRGVHPPPVIASWRGGQLVLEDGNHRVEALRRAGRSRTWALIAFDDPEDRERFERSGGR